MKKREPFFWDSSAVVALCVPAQGAVSLYQLLRAQTQMVVWWGASVEVASALFRLERQGVLTPDERAASAQRLERWRRTWVEVLPGDDLRQLAERALASVPVRAGDAFQLGAALVWCRQQPRGRPFVCLDQRLRSAARALGFSALPD